MKVCIHGDDPEFCDACCIKDLRVKLAELKKQHDANLSRWEVSEQTFVTKHESDLCQRVVDLTRERDEALEHKKLLFAQNVRLLEEKEAGLWDANHPMRSQILLSAASELRLREALGIISEYACVWCRIQITKIANVALSAQPTELAAALGEMMDAVRAVANSGYPSTKGDRASLVGVMDELVSLSKKALSRVEAALKGKA